MKRESLHYEVWLNMELAVIYTGRAEAEAGALRHHAQRPGDQISVKDDSGSLVWLPDWRAA